MTTRDKNKFDTQRRNFFKTVAAAGITPALLSASSLVGGMMWSRSTEAATGANKSVAILGSGGSLDEYWRPSNNLVLPQLTAPYEDIKNEMNFIVGGSMSGGGHGIPWHRFNDGSWGSDSFDVNLGRTIGANHPVKFLNLGVQADSGVSRTQSGFVPTINDPKTALNQLFPGGIPSGDQTSSQGDVSNGQQSIVDAHKDAMDALKTKLGYHEKHKLDSHLTAIEEFEKRIETTSSSSNDAGTCGPAPSLNTDGSFIENCKLQTEIAILGLKCGLTPSVSLAFGNDNHTYVIRNGRISHDTHHNGSASDYLADQTEMSHLVANVIRRLKEEGLLSSTVVTHVTDMGDARSHSNNNVALFMAGAGIKGGQVTQVSASVTQRELYQTAAYILGAEQHANFRSWGRSGLSQVVI